MSPNMTETRMNLSQSKFLTPTKKGSLLSVFARKGLISLTTAAASNPVASSRSLSPGSDWFDTADEVRQAQHRSDARDH